MQRKRNLLVGLAVGRGTGPELASVFERVIRELAAYYGVSVALRRSPRLYHSYFSLEDDFSLDPTMVSTQSHEDVEHYLSFCTGLLLNGGGDGEGNVIFRTAINAQSLYLVRQHFEAVKVEHFRQPEGEMLLVRDQAQGFYTGSNRHDVDAGTVTRDCVFAKEIMARLLDFSLERAKQTWGGGETNGHSNGDSNGNGINGGVATTKPVVDRILLVYKFHLFDGVLSAWADDWSRERGGVPIQFVQPDTANRNLLAFGLKGRQLVLAGNEWGDIMHVVLLHLFGNVAQEERCTENVYLAPHVKGLVEYQTVHGSADDIGGKGVVNPSATMRAAAAILETKADCQGVQGYLEQAFKEVEKQGIGTGDQKRAKSVGTGELVDRVMVAFAEREHRPNREM